MDLFEHRYYRLSKKCMTLLGQWPYQSALVRRGVLAVIIFVGVTGIAPLILALVKNRDNWTIVLDCVISFLFTTIGVIKLLGITWNSQKTFKLLDRIFTNWQVWARGREAKILHEYSKHGEKMTIVYTATVYSTIILYMTQPMIPKIIDVMLKNGTKLGKFPYPVDYYYFDAQKYYYYVMMHFYVCACVAPMPLVASDNMLIIYVQHVCGVLAALGYADLIEATYTWNFFFTIGLGTILINIVGIQILTRTNEPESTIRFVAFILSLHLVFYVNCYISQILMDHSINVDFYIYNSQWYGLLPKDQKLLQLMTMRCRLPCQLTAGKLLIMSMRNFWLTIKTAMSYFAVVRPK